MTLNEYRSIVKCNNREKVVLIKFGNFYRCSDDDALILFYLFNYKLSDKYQTGFPLKNLDKVLYRLKDLNISCVVINTIGEVIYYDIIDNSYSTYLDKSKGHYNYIWGVNVIMEIVKKSLFNDLDNLGKIKDFILNL